MNSKGNKRRKKQKNRWKNKIRWKGIGLGMAAAAAAALFFVAMCQPKEIQVTGNYRYTDGEIRQMVKREPLAFNTVLLTALPFRQDLSGATFLKSISYEMVSPTVVRAVVEEKKAVGFILSEDALLYFDEEGKVLESIAVAKEGEEAAGILTIEGLEAEAAAGLDTENLSKAELRVKEYHPTLEDIPLVTGLQEESRTAGTLICSGRQKIFETLAQMERLMDKYEIWADRIHISSEDTFSLYYGENIRVRLGDDQNIEEKMIRLAAIYPQISDRKGELHMEDVDRKHTDVLFSQGELTPEEETE